MNTELTWLRRIGFVEGLSALSLFFVAMPLKYIWGNDALMAISGNLHGFLFVAYCIMVFVVGNKYKWQGSIYGLSIFMAIIPFGAFYWDSKFFKPLSTK